MFSAAPQLRLLQLPIGAEEADWAPEDLEEPSSDGEEYFRLGEEDESFKDYSNLKLKPDHENRRAAGAASAEA